MEQPRLEQVRKLVTEIPGLLSRELWERRTRAIPAGVGTTLPVRIPGLKISIAAIAEA